MIRQISAGTLNIGHPAVDGLSIQSDLQLHPVPMMQFIRPVPVGYNEVDLSWLFGRAVGQVSFNEPALWSFNFGEGLYISVECLWRLVEHRRVVLTNEDHGHQFGLPAPVNAVARSTELLSGRNVIAVQLREATADITLEFTGNLRLEIIPTSSGYESWQLLDPSGTSYVAQGGGQICRWNQ